jgi:hypothetical protein
MISLRARAGKCKLHSGDDNFHERTTQERAGSGENSNVPGYKPAISVFRLSISQVGAVADSGPANAAQSARDRSSITSTRTHRNFKHARAQPSCTTVEIQRPAARTRVMHGGGPETTSPFETRESHCECKRKRGKEKDHNKKKSPPGWKIVTKVTIRSPVILSR